MAAVEPIWTHVEYNGGKTNTGNGEADPQRAGIARRETAEEDGADTARQQVELTLISVSVPDP